MASIAAHRSFLADIQARQNTRRAAIDPTCAWTPQPVLHDGNAVAGPSGTSKGVDYISKANVANYIPEEESVRNDYAAWYGASGEWGSNFVLGADEGQVCEEFPALKKLMDLKSKLVDSVAHPPFYLTLPGEASSEFSSINTALTQTLGSNRFDVILITPPPTATWDDIASLPLRALSADPGFVYLWVGPASGDGLERGRETFAKWGFRRAEDIVWVKTNKGRSRAEGGMDQDAMSAIGEKDVEVPMGTGRDQGGLFVGQKEHCLMGIRGTVRRSTDGRFVHCNVDTDIMLWEDDRDMNCPRYPPYLHTLIENFCLGTRRLHLFGTPSDSRRGWVTVGTDDLATTVAKGHPSDVQAFNADSYPSSVYRAEDGRAILPYEAEIDNLRPKSPVRKPRNLPGQSQRDINTRNVRPNGPPRFDPQHNQNTPMSPQQQMYSVSQQTYNQQQPQVPMQHGVYGQVGFGHQQQFDPNILAQAQAHAQAQMVQMQMMMQMQAQAQMQAQLQSMMMGNAGMGLGMGMGMGMSQGSGAQGIAMHGVGLGQGIGQGQGVSAVHMGGMGMATGGWQSQSQGMGQHMAPAQSIPQARIEHLDQGEDEEMGESWQAGE